MIVWSNFESFLWIEMILTVSKRIGKLPLINKRLNKLASCSEISFLNSFYTLVGILYGPVALLISRKDRSKLNFFFV